MRQGGESRWVLDANTLVPVGSVLSIGYAMFRMWMFFSLEFATIHSNSDRLLVLEKEIRWTCQDQKDFLYELKILNPQLVIPPAKPGCTR